MSKRAIILAGGVGTRLRPYTTVLPKPMMPIGEYPILEVVIRQLVNQRFDHITLAVNHQAELIKAFFTDGSKWGISIDYAFEDKPLGTMGPLSLINDLPKHFLIMNGDILTDLQYDGFYNSHVQQDALFTISSYRRHHIVDYGVLETGDAGILTSFYEKPSKSFQVSMGIYMASRRILEMIPDDSYFGFDNLMKKLIATGMRVHVKEFAGYWLDIGRPDDYVQAIDEFESMKGIFLNG